MVEERYSIKSGRFGAYFYDTFSKKPLDLYDIQTLLNISNKTFEKKASLEIKDKIGDAIGSLQSCVENAHEYGLSGVYQAIDTLKELLKKIETYDLESQKLRNYDKTEEEVEESLEKLRRNSETY